MEVTMKDDILIDIADKYLPHLAKIYESHQDRAPFVYSMINNGIKWKEKSTEIVRFMSPNGNWRKDGTFIAEINYGFRHVFIFTLEKSEKNRRFIMNDLLQSERLFRKNPVPMYTLFFNVYQTVHPQLIQALESNNYKIENIDDDHIMYYMKKEDALKLEAQCSPNVDIKKLDPSMLPTIIECYHNKGPDAEQFLETVILLNTCYGVFLKSNGELVSWVLRSCLGQLAILQTVDGHLKNGYGSLIVKFTAIQIAKDGFNPYAAVAVNNKPSRKLFEKLGFENIGECKYFGITL